MSKVNKEMSKEERAELLKELSRYKRKRNLWVSINILTERWKALK